MVLHTQDIKAGIVHEIWVVERKPPIEGGHTIQHPAAIHSICLLVHSTSISLDTDKTIINFAAEDNHCPDIQAQHSTSASTKDPVKILSF